MTPGGPMTPHSDLVTRLLRELVTLVRGECPALLNEDSGGDARLSLAIDDALAALPPPADPPHDCEAWRLEGLGCARCNKADPPALVALVREIGHIRARTLEATCPDCDGPACDHGKAYDPISQIVAKALAASAVDLVAVENATWAGAVAYVRDLASTVRAMAQKFVSDPGMAELAKVRAEALDSCADGMERAAKKARAAAPPVTDTPQGCPTCGGPRPCDRCTTRNVVDVDALKARLESERLRAAAEIVKLIADDSWAIAFQSLGQYRSALLKAWRDSAPAAPPQEDQ